MQLHFSHLSLGTYRYLQWSGSCEGPMRRRIPIVVTSFFATHEFICVPMSNTWCLSGTGTVLLIVHQATLYPFCSLRSPLPNVPTPSSKNLDNLGCNSNCQRHPYKYEGLVYGVRQGQLRPDTCSTCQCTHSATSLRPGTPPNKDSLAFSLSFIFSASLTP